MSGVGVASAVDRFLATAAGGALSARPFGLRLWDGSELAPRPGAVDPPTIVIRHPVALAYILREPNQVGLGRAWVTGAIDLEGDMEQTLELRHQLGGISLSLVDRLRALALARQLAGRTAFRRPPLPATEARLDGRLHSLRRDSSAVRHHYDVPDAFYRLVLGPSMAYTCAYFESPQDTLEAAQERKLERICRKLNLRPGDRLLDIGCGWGSLILHAAVHHGVRAVGVTLSPVQAEVARERIREAGASDLCEVRVADYREVADGPFDAIASVGMYEHVGRRHLGEYSQTIADLLAPGGLFLNHGIARLRPEPINTRTFMNHFVFPDGELHTLPDLLVAATAAGFELRDVESMREHYALTLRRWSANLEANREAAVAAAGVERERIWRLYMPAGASAFADGEQSIFQTLLVKPGAPHRLPLARAL